VAKRVEIEREGVGGGVEVGIVESVRKIDTVLLDKKSRRRMRRALGRRLAEQADV
jgi:hypothetical protein